MPGRCLAEVVRRVGCVFRRAVQFCNKRFDVFLVLQGACGFAVSIFWVLILCVSLFCRPNRSLKTHFNNHKTVTT